MSKIVPSLKAAREKSLAHKSDVASVAIKPFLRWAGGKRRLTGLLMEAFPENFDPKSGRFFEPFVGGGALSFATGDSTKKPYILGRNLFINDANPDLVIVYTVVRDNLAALISELEKLSLDVSKQAYEFVRSSNPKSDVKRAARFIYLNKTCFNGLWRVNSSGQFNVPWGQLKNPLIFDANQLTLCSKRLKGSKITNGGFKDSVKSARQGDLVYFDPPYIPLTSTASFSQYAKANFGLQDHIDLANTIAELTSRGVNVILSNSDTEMTREIFQKSLTLRQISMNRSISASSGSRQPVNEVIGTNFRVKKGTLLAGLELISKQRAGV